MFATVFKVGLALVFAGLLGGCAGSPVYHENIMRGQIVGVDGDQVVLCIGSRDGAKPGMTFDVFHVNYDEIRYRGYISADANPYRRELAGSVTIEEVIDQHFARAKIKSGDIQRNDIVELQDSP